MNVARIAGHTFAAASGSTVWLVGIHMPGTDPNPALNAVAILPWLVAGVTLIIAHHVDALEAAGRGKSVAASPRAVVAVKAPPKRRELVR